MKSLVPAVLFNADKITVYITASAMTILQLYNVNAN